MFVYDMENLALGNITIFLSSFYPFSFSFLFFISIAALSWGYDQYNCLDFCITSFIYSCLAPL